MPVKISQTFGPNTVDWENRVDMSRLREERLARLNAQLEKSELGALLSFDFANIRYMTSTHIGTWAVDKLIRFALLPRGGKPVLWDFGSAAKHHQMYAPWLPAENFGTRAAGMCTFSVGLRGFTPVRAARCCAVNLPNPVKATSPPLLRVSVIVSRNASTALPASRAVN